LESIYKINNIWKLNQDHYEKIPSESTVSKDTSQKERDTSQKHNKIPPRSTIEEEQRKEEHIKNNTIAASNAAGKDIKEIIDLFQEVNPSYRKMFGNTTQRAAIERMLKLFGRQKVEDMVKALPMVNAKKYWPKSTTPVQLEDNLGKYQALNKERSQSKAAVII